MKIKNAVASVGKCARKPQRLKDLLHGLALSSLKLADIVLHSLMTMGTGAVIPVNPFYVKFI